MMGYGDFDERIEDAMCFTQPASQLRAQNSTGPELLGSRVVVLRIRYPSIGGTLVLGRAIVVQGTMAKDLNAEVSVIPNSMARRGPGVTGEM
jgi:hypothetical protein